MNSYSRSLMMIVALAAIGLVDCSSTPPAPPGSHADSGSTAGAVGSACASDSDCSNGASCDTNLPSGYCTGSCAANSDCPANSTCGMISGQQACEQGCSSNTDCRQGYICDQATAGCLPGGCTQASDCASGQYCDASGQCQSGCTQDSDCNSGTGGQYCDTNSHQCTAGCTQDSECTGGMICNVQLNMCQRPVLAGDAGSGTDGGIVINPDAGTGSGTDAGPLTCADYADPTTAAPCVCKAGQTCGANNCFGGYYCLIATKKCVPEPAVCGGADGGTTADAGHTPDAGTTTDAGPTTDAGTTTDAGASSSACTTCTAHSCPSGQYCDCVDSACTMTTCTVGCPSTGTCPKSGWTCQMAVAASTFADGGTKTFSDCLPASQTCN